MHVSLAYNRLGDVQQCWWATDLLEYLEKPVSADEIKRFCEVDEGHVQRSPLFPAFLLQIAY